MQAFAQGEARAWWWQSELPGELVDSWLTDGPLLRRHRRETHPVLFCALHTWGVRALNVRELEPQAAPRLLRPLARRLRNQPWMHRAVELARLRFVELAVLVPQLRHPDSEVPIAAAPVIWLSSRSGARHDRARLQLDMRADDVKLTVDRDGVGGHIAGRSTTCVPVAGGGPDVVDLLHDHACCAPTATHFFQNALDVQRRASHLARVHLGAGLLSGLHEYEDTAAATFTEHRWTLSGPFERPEEAVDLPALP